MLAKYYSLDECNKVDDVFNHLDSIQEDGKIVFESLEDDVFKIRDTGLSPKELKELVSYFEKNDVIEYLDYEDPYSDDEDDDFEDDEDDDFEDDF
jgi:hypothetical protein